MNLSITLALTDFEQHQDKEEDRMDIDVHSFIALDLLKNINVSGRIETEVSYELIFKGKKDLIYFILIYSSFLLFFNLHGNRKIFVLSYQHYHFKRLLFGEELSINRNVLKYDVKIKF